MAGHSGAFTAVRDLILELEDGDRARLARFFGTMTEPGAPLGDLRAVLRAIAELDDADLERLVGWFSHHVEPLGADAAGDRPAR
jgi:hypothetical protein